MSSASSLTNIVIRFLDIRITFSEPVATDTTMDGLSTLTSYSTDSLQYVFSPPAVWPK